MKSVAVLAIAVVALAGCSSGGPTSVAPVPAKSEFGVGDPVVFTRASDGLRVGAFTVIEAVAVPAECVDDPSATGQVLAIRAEIVNDGQLKLPRPDMYSAKAQDAGGFTQNMVNAILSLDCKAQYPEIASSQAPGKTSGWAIFEVAQANPTALVYVPYVTDEGSTLQDINFVVLSPRFATVKLPTPLPAGAAPAAASTAPSITRPTTALTTTRQVPKPPTPAAGQACTPGTDNWATDASGGQLKCAYAGGPAPTWVESAPFIGTRTPGTPCDLGVAAVAESSAGQTLICSGDRGSATWTPGP